MRIGSSCFGLAAWTLLCAAASAGAPLRTWQPEGAQDVEAALVKEDGGKAVLQRPDGPQLTLETKRLATEDLRYLKNVREAVNEFRSWTPRDLPAFQASFVKVTGFDSVRSKSYAVLIKDNGTRRAWPLEILSEADRAYVAKMQAAATRKPEKPADPYEVEWLDYDPVKDKDKVNHQLTGHFRFVWGNAIDESAKRWADPRFREMNAAYFERMWDFYQHEMGVPMPHAKAERKLKTNVFITSTGLPKHQKGWAFGGKAIMIHPRAMEEGSSVIPHEFSHSLQLSLGGFRNSPYVGWFWECHANWSCHQFIPSYPPALFVYVDRAHYELSSTRMNYGSWPFLQYLAEHPRFDPAFCYRIWEVNRKNERDQSIETPFQTIMRLGVEQGLFAGDGLADFGGLIGEMAAHNVTWDYVCQHVYQEEVARHNAHMREASRQRVLLQPVADRPGWFQPLYSHAPRQFGINLVDLVPEPNARRVEVDFQGIVDEAEGSDWRVTLVAVDDRGEARYSRMWRRGKGSMSLKPNEKRLALAVAAAPSVYKPLGFRIGYNRKRRYPYEVAFAGCRPAAAPPGLPTRPQGVEGAPHPHGGGFVARTAKADPTAYVGKDAMVLDRAQVLGHARIEDHAVVQNQAKVSGNAVVCGYARVKDRCEVAGNARVRDAAALNGSVKIAGNARILEYARLHGDGAVRGDALIKGFGDVHTAKAADITGSVVIGEDIEMHTGDWKGGPIEHGLLYGYITNPQLERERKDHRHLYAHWDFAQPRQAVLKDAFADNDGALRGRPAFRTDGARTILTLNGRDQYALLEAHPIDSADLTIDMQIQWDGGEAGQRVLDFGSPDASLAFTPKDADGKAALILRKGQVTQALRGDAPLPTGKWTRVTITLKGREGKLYIDGKEAGRNAALTLSPGDLRATAGFLGRAFGGGGHFKGSLDDLAIYRTAFPDVAAIPPVQEP